MGGKSEIRPGKKGKTLKGPPKPQVETKVVSSGRWRQKPQETLDLKKKKKPDADQLWSLWTMGGQWHYQSHWSLGPSNFCHCCAATSAIYNISLKPQFLLLLHGLIYTSSKMALNINYLSLY